jgi:hypothetical protein
VPRMTRHVLYIVLNVVPLEMFRSFAATIAAKAKRTNGASLATRNSSSGPGSEPTALINTREPDTTKF